MNTIRILCQYSVLLVCVAACGVMAVCLGVCTFFHWVVDLLCVGWEECEKLSERATPQGKVGLDEQQRQPEGR